MVSKEFEDSNPEDIPDDHNMEKFEIKNFEKSDYSPLIEDIIDNIRPQGKKSENGQGVLIKLTDEQGIDFYQNIVRLNESEISEIFSQVSQQISSLSKSRSSSKKATSNSLSSKSNNTVAQQKSLLTLNLISENSSVQSEKSIQLPESINASKVLELIDLKQKKQQENIIEEYKYEEVKENQNNINQNAFDKYGPNTRITQDISTFKSMNSYKDSSESSTLKQVLSPENVTHEININDQVNSHYSLDENDNFSEIQNQKIENLIQKNSDISQSLTSVVCPSHHEEDISNCDENQFCEYNIENLIYSMNQSSVSGQSNLYHSQQSLFHTISSKHGSLGQQQSLGNYVNTSNANLDM